MLPEGDKGLFPKYVVAKCTSSAFPWKILERQDETVDGVPLYVAKFAQCYSMQDRRYAIQTARELNEKRN